MHPIQFSRFHSIDNFPILTALTEWRKVKKQKKSFQVRFWPVYDVYVFVYSTLPTVQIRQYKFIVVTISRQFVAFS